MADRPILFSAPMVRALLAGTKTQTRRVAKFIEPIDDGEFHIHNAHGGLYGVSPADVPTDAVDYAPIAVGDRLWVREAHYLTDDGDQECAVYAADEEAVRDHNKQMEALAGRVPEEVWRRHVKLRPSIHMPRWASRLTLTVTDVRVQRLQEISEEDARAEGVGVDTVGGCRGLFADPAAMAEYPDCTPLFFARGDDGDDALQFSAVAAYRRLWGQINGAGAWEQNPWVAAYTFTVERRNIDMGAPHV